MFLMNPKREDTRMRQTRRKYEDSHKDIRQKRSGNFQAMMPREDFVRVCAFVDEHKITKVQFVKEAFELMQHKYDVITDGSDNK